VQAIAYKDMTTVKDDLLCIIVVDLWPGSSFSAMTLLVGSSDP